MFEKKNLMAFFTIAAVGTLGHFIFEWTNNNLLLGLFFPINESIWEHLKLLFFPTVIFSLSEYIFLKEKPQNYISAVANSVFYGMFFIVITYYTYTGVLGKNIDVINIALYYLSIFVMLIKKEKIISKNKFSVKIFDNFYLVLIILTTLIFIFLSFNGPKFGIFAPPEFVA